LTASLRTGAQSFEVICMTESLCSGSGADTSLQVLFVFHLHNVVVHKLPRRGRRDCCTPTSGPLPLSWRLEDISRALSLLVCPEVSSPASYESLELLLEPPIGVCIREPTPPHPRLPPTTMCDCFNRRYCRIQTSVERNRFLVWCSTTLSRIPPATIKLIKFLHFRR